MTATFGTSNHNHKNKLALTEVVIPWDVGAEASVLPIRQHLVDSIPAERDDQGAVARSETGKAGEQRC